MANRAGWLAFLACAGAVVVARPALAGPVVSVGARTDLQIDPVRRALGYDAITVGGQLVDKYSRAPIAWQRLRIAVDGDAREVQTGSDGRFEAYFAGVVGGGHHLAVDFDSTDEYSGSHYDDPSFDITKRPLSLSVSIDHDVVPYKAPELHVTVTATSDQPPALLRPIELWLSEEDASATARQVGSLVTDSGGKAELILRGALLGSPGRRVLEARFAGNAEYDAARSERPFLVRTETSLGFDLDDADVAYESTVRARGRLLDDAGAGIADARIVLTAQDRKGTREVARASSGADGSYTLSVAASELGSDRFQLQATYDSEVDWRRSSRSTPRLLVVAPPRPAPVSYTLLVFGATLLAVLAFVVMRTRPWERFRRKPRTAPAAASEEERPGDDGPRGGLQLARPSMMSTLRRVRDTGFTGAVCNVVTGRPIGGATITLDSAAHGQQTVDTDGAGKFAIEGLGGGDWQVAVATFGYVTERFTIHVPHRGELRGARVDLLPVRERIFALYGECAKPLLPDVALWGIWTPRQIFAHVRDHRPAPALSELTDFVEESYFSQRTPGEEQIDVTREHIARARQERV